MEVTDAHEAALDDSGTRARGVFRVPPLPGETTSSLISRIAERYGMEAKTLRSGWQWRNYPPRHEGGGMRADAEVLLSKTGQQVLAQLSGISPGTLARALLAWGLEDPKLWEPKPGAPVGLWRIGGALVGPVAYACRLCTARRATVTVRAVRYAPGFRHE